MMFQKKLLPVLLTAVFAASAAGQAMLPAAQAFAKSSVSFYAGTAGVEQFEGRKPYPIDMVCMPQGCSVSVYTSDKQQEKGTLVPEDEKKMDVIQLHKGSGWYVSGKKAGKTGLAYKRGSQTGTIRVQILPALKLSAVKKSVRVSGGKTTLAVTYKNSTGSDITVEAADIGKAKIRYEGEKEPSKEDVTPARWIAKKVTIPAGKTKTISVTEPAKASRILKYDYPVLYFKYEGVYFYAKITNQAQASNGMEYRGTQPFAEFLK